MEDDKKKIIDTKPSLYIYIWRGRGAKARSRPAAMKDKSGCPVNVQYNSCK